jgi:AcrR family transcriptional regulator
LRAAIELFSIHGFNGVSTRDVAKAVGIASPSIYKHFSSMDEVTHEALRSVAQVQFQECVEVMALDVNPAERLKAMAITLARGFLKNPAFIQLFLAERRGSLVLAGRRESLAWIQSSFDLYPLFHKAISAVDSNVNPTLAYFFIFSCLLGMATYLPMHEMRRSLSKQERHPAFLAEHMLAAALPMIDWKKVRNAV